MTNAVTIRSITGLRLPDAIVIGSALLAGCEAIVSNDADWKRKLEPLFQEFKWLCPGDYV